MISQTRRRARLAAAVLLVPGTAAAIADITGLGERRLRGMQIAPFSPLLALPSTLAVVTAAAARRPAVTTFAATLAAWQIGLVRCAPTRTTNADNLSRCRSSNGTDLRLGTVNLQRNAMTAAAVAASMVRRQVDVVVAEEFTPDTRPAFADVTFATRFPHRFEAPEAGYFGSAVYSRFPIIAADDRLFGGRHMVVATIDHGSSPVTVVAVHLQAPIHRHDETPWRSGFRDLADLVRSNPGPVVLAGDWNATMGSRPFRRLLHHHRLVDAHLATGRPRARTWPAGHALVPPLLLLDHVVVGGGVAVRSVREYRADGSDHLGLVAELVVP